MRQRYGPGSKSKVVRADNFPGGGGKEKNFGLNHYHPFSSPESKVSDTKQKHEACAQVQGPRG